MDCINKIIEKFKFNTAKIREISDMFYKELEERKDLKMLSSFLSYPTGKEKGKYLALDFGGSNIRVSLIELYGDNSFKILKNIKRPLVLQERYNYLTLNTKGRELFNFIALMIKDIIGNDEKYYLGHTFSFPFRQDNSKDAYLIEWTKEFKTSGVEGENITNLLNIALHENNIFNVEPIVVINDTVATFLAAAYLNRNVIVGSICGTGHNTACLLDEIIVNLESGNFSKMPLTKYDEEFDALTEKPGKQLLEKLSSGRYLGEIFRVICLELLNKGFFTDANKAKEVLLRPNIISSETLSSIIRANDYREIMRIMSRLNLTIKDKESLILVELAKNIIKRAASLVAVTYLGIINKINVNHTDELIIAIDGSLYEKMPLYKETIDEVIAEGREIYNIKNRVKVIFENRGSELGAAIAAAIAKNNIC